MPGRTDLIPRLLSTHLSSRILLVGNGQNPEAPFSLCGMPALEVSTFSPPVWLRSPSIQTIFPALFRPKSHKLHPQLESLDLSDGDSLELAWFGRDLNDRKDNRLAIITHGLEGSINSGYVVGLTKALTQAGYLTLTWNMRGCGSKPNKLPSWYHSGKSEDLKAVVDHAHACYPESSIFLVGISIGGNILCKYLGEQGKSVPAKIMAAVSVSAPLDLRGSALTLARRSRRLYMQYLMRPLRERVKSKAAMFPDLIDASGVDDITSFAEFDSRYTAPVHGFNSVDHYWDVCSGSRFLDSVRVPLLLVSALDDPFLSPECFPYQQASNSRLITLETPRYGGHVGFIDSLTMRDSWLERMVVEFFGRDAE